LQERKTEDCRKKNRGATRKSQGTRGKTGEKPREDRKRKNA